jgi:hypothetical protein
MVQKAVSAVSSARPIAAASRRRPGRLADQRQPAVTIRRARPVTIYSDPMPNQQGGTEPASAELASVSAAARPGGAEVTTADVRRTGKRPITTKSSDNRLVHVRQD